MNKNNASVYPDVVEKTNDLIGEKYCFTTHKSGLRIYLVPKKLSTVYAVIGVGYGSLHNRFGKIGEDDRIEVPDGIAHFLEHKMFENEDGVDTSEKFAETGAQSNAYTTFDKTAYLFSCTGSFADSLDILFDCVTHPYFTDETVKKEQGIIAQEIRMGDDNPGRALMFGMLKSLYHNCAVKKEIAGTVESISRITPELLYSCYDRFYNLNNMILCVSGDVTMDEIIASADRSLKPSDDFDTECVMPDEPDGIVRANTVIRMQVSKPLFAIGIKNTRISDDPAERMKQSAAISIIFDTLYGKSSAFFNDMYERGLVNGSIDIWSEHNACFSFICLSGESDDPDKLYSEFEAYTAKALESGLDPEDFTRCKRVMYAGYVSSFDSTDDIANELLDHAFDGGDLLDYPQICASVDLDYANGLLREIVRREHITQTVVEPVKEKNNDD